MYLCRNLWHFVPLIRRAIYQIKNMLDWKTRFRQTIAWLHWDLAHVYRHWKEKKEEESREKCISENRGKNAAKQLKFIA